MKINLNEFLRDKTKNVNELEMWNFLAKSENVLHEYYYRFGKKWPFENKQKLIQISGKTITEIKKTLKDYRKKERMKNHLGIRFSAQQVTCFKTHFKDCQYPSSQELEQMTKKTGLDAMQVMRWFRNQRRRAAGDIVKNTKQKKTPYFSIESILSEDFPKKQK